MVRQIQATSLWHFQRIVNSAIQPISAGSRQRLITTQPSSPLRERIFRLHRNVLSAIRPVSQEQIQLVILAIKLHIMVRQTQTTRHWHFQRIVNNAIQPIPAGNHQRSTTIQPSFRLRGRIFRLQLNVLSVTQPASPEQVRHVIRVI